MIETMTSHEVTEPRDFASLLQAAVALGLSDVELDVAGMTSLPDDLAQLQGMETVALYNCDELLDVAVFQRFVFPRLKAIAFLGDSKADCEKHDHMDASATARLARCAAQGTPRRLLELSPLRHIAGLARLEIHVDQAVELEFLRHLPGLVELQLTNAWVRDFSPIGALVQLRALGLRANDHLQDLSFLAPSATVLASLSVSYCTSLCDASELAACSALEILSLNATALQVLTLPQASQNLAILDLRSQTELASIEGLGGQACLQLITIIGCGRLVELPLSGDLPTLAFLTIRNCAELQSIGVLARSPLVEGVLLAGNPLLARFMVCGDLTRLKSLHVIGCPGITDLPALAGSPLLEVIHLDGCVEMRSLPSLRGLSHLQELHVRDSKIHDIDSFEGLSALNRLVLNRLFELQSLPSMVHLTSLEVLDLGLCPYLQTLDGPVQARGLRVLKLNSCERLLALFPVSGLPSLEEIDLTYCHKLCEIPDLVDLPNLCELVVKKCDDLKKMGRLERLPKLRRLALHTCPRLTRLPDLVDLASLAEIVVTICGRLSSLGALRKLPALQRVSISWDNQITDLAKLERFPTLKSVELFGCTAIRDVRFLGALGDLRDLVLKKCPGITDLQPLAALTRLESLDLRGTATLDVSPGALPFAKLEALKILNADRLQGAPSELGSEDNVNILPAIRAWQRDLLVSEAPDSVVKIFILGNGSVGKTQIARRLQGLPFDESVASTHGIDLGECQILEAEDEYVGVRARLWDFGGQDIYLSTHSLFLDERAIFIVAWHPRFENTDAYEENSIQMRNRPLQYWLEYVYSHVGDAASILVVQTQCDRQADVQPAPIAAAHPQRHVVTVASSAKRVSGVDALQHALRHAAMKQLETFGKTRMPQSWRQIYAAMASRRHERLMSRQAFDALCQSVSPETPPEAITNYLHNAGEIFFARSLFGGQVVLDLSWMLDGIYELFKRDGVLPVLVQQKGHFSRALLDSLFWRDRQEGERTLLLSVMKSCETVIEVAKDHFVVPTLLRGAANVAGEMQTIWQHREAADSIRLSYAFLHEGILRRVLHSIGQRAGYRAVYWMYGICYFDSLAHSIVRISAQLPDVAAGTFGGSILIEAVAASPGEARRRAPREHTRRQMEGLADAISSINIGMRPTAQVNYGESGDALLSDKAADLGQLAQPGIPPGPARQSVPVHVSYAWTADSQAMVDEIEKRLPAGVDFRRDRNVILPGDSMTDFMKQLSRGSHIFVVLSRDYMLRLNCMYELISIHRLCLDEKNYMLDRVIPLFVAGTPDYGRAAERDLVVTHWQKKYEELQALLDRRGFYSIGSRDRDELIMVQDFVRHTSDILFWLSDVLMPRGMGAVEDAVSLLERRIAGRSRT